MNLRNVTAQPGLIVLDGQAGHLYNEAAFRYFLDVERKRAEDARRQLLLVLVNRRSNLLARPPFAARTAKAVLDALNACVREVDLVGWYRDGFIAASLLHIGGVAASGTRQALYARVVAALQQRLGQDSARLQVRVLAVGRKPRT